MLTAHRSISLFAASFFASMCLGIHHTPFSTYIFFTFFQTSRFFFVKSYFLFILHYPVFNLLLHLNFLIKSSILNKTPCSSTVPCTVFLLRKEVIHPHLPVGIPCYDFTPIIYPTCDGCLPKVSSPASGVTNSRGVTGGVYKTRERIHRSMLTYDY